MLTRRQFLAGAPALALAPPSPNIILIVMDDQRWDALSCFERPTTLGFIRTPNMDRLAREGVRFTNAFVTFSLCSPSRASIQTGQYPSTHGVEALERDLRPDAVTFPGLLQKAGYETGYVGKYHLGKDSDRPRPQFDFWSCFRGQGTYFDPVLNTNGQSRKISGYNNDIVTDHALEFISRRRSKPFFLQIGYKAPHDPVTPPRHMEDLYSDVQVPLPSTWNETHGDKPAWYVEQHDHDFFHLRFQPREKYDKYVKDYCRTIVSVDENIGRLLTTLNDKGLAGNTVIIHTSDNGHFLAEHQCYSKMLMYEESIRIPLLVRWPEGAKPAQLRDEQVLNIDFAPTILELAGAGSSAAAQGRSFAAMIRGKSVSGWRKSWRYEYSATAGWGLPSFEGVRRNDGWKYVRFPDWEQLYNLREDPTEIRNLAGDPAARKQKARLAAELKRLGGGGPLAAARPYKRHSEPVHTPH
jgi:arylsulfatase A-like enzyme